MRARDFLEMPFGDISGLGNSLNCLQILGLPADHHRTDSPDGQDLFTLKGPGVCEVQENFGLGSAHREMPQLGTSTIFMVWSLTHELTRYFFNYSL